MCEDGGLIGYGMAPAVYVVPVGGAQPREATGRAVGPVMSSARALIVPEITLDRAPRLAVRIR